MKTFKIFTLYCLLALCLLALFSCYESANEKQSFNQLKADPDRAMAMKYKSILEAKAPAIWEIYTRELDIQKGAPFTPNDANKIESYISTPEGKELKSYFEDFERYLLYYTKVKEKGGDLSGLELDSFSSKLKDMILPPVPEEELPAELKKRKSV